MTIKVVHLSNFDVALNIHLKNYMCYLREQRYDVRIICNPGQFLKGDTITEYGIPVKAIPFSNRYAPWDDLKTLVQLYRYFRQERFDIVHTHTVKPGLLGRLAARLAGVPVVIHTVHGFHIWDTMSAPEIRLMIGIERFANHFCDLLLSQNREDMAYAVKHRICSSEKIHFLGNGIDLTQFHPQRVCPEQIAAKRQELGLDPDEPVVGMIGRLVQLKGYHEYVAAARILKDRGERVRFLAIGAAQKGKAEALSPQDLIAQQEVEDRVLVLGVRQDVPELLAMMDVVVLASYAEGIPRILLEAAAMGRPSIGTDVRGTREVIVDGVTGRLIPVHNASALADAISRLCADKAQAQKMGMAARAHAEANFDERFHFWRTDAEYRRLIMQKLASNRILELQSLPTAAASVLTPSVSIGGKQNGNGNDGIPARDGPAKARPSPFLPPRYY